MVRIGTREQALERVLRDESVCMRGGAPEIRLRPEDIGMRVSGFTTLMGALDRLNLPMELESGGSRRWERDDQRPPRCSLVGIPAKLELDLVLSARTVAVRAPTRTEENS